MVKVVGHWEIGYMAPIMEHHFWGLPLWDFGVTEWYMWPVSGIKNNIRKTNLYEKETLKEILEINKDVKHIYVEPYNPAYPITNCGTDLREFEHPKDALYIFGSAHYNPLAAHKREEDLAVTIPTIQNAGVLWANQCVVMILYDRIVKEWQLQSQI